MRPSRIDRSWMTYLAFCILLAIAILGLFFPIQDGGGGGDNEISPRYLLVLDDNTTQPLGLVNQWKNILFHHQKVSSPAFFYPDSPPWDYVRSLVPGYYRVYLSIQTEAPATTRNTSYHCRACHLTYAIRAVQQLGGIGPLYDIGDSFTTIARDVSFLSKEFIMLVNNGDIIRFQFKSLCPDLTLTPLPTTATLIITSV
jgi:hypothetical protein